MPKDISTGFSDVTDIKQEEIKRLVANQITIINAIKNKYYNNLRNWSNFTFNYIDTNAGVGILYNGSKGSPLVFLDEVKKISSYIKFNIILIENNKKAFKKLVSSIYENSYYRAIVSQKNTNLKIFNGDNEEVLNKYFLNEDNKKKYGFIYCDPNGTPNYDMIKTITKHKSTSTLDLILNFNLTQAKRNRGAHSHIKNHSIPLEEHLCNINKKYFFIRPITTTYTDKWHWHLIIGTNYEKYKVGRKYIKYTKKDNNLISSSSEGRTLINKLSIF